MKSLPPSLQSHLATGTTTLAWCWRVTRNDDTRLGFTDHDDVRAYWQALRWVAAHPGCRVRPLWGLELTIRAFKHLLVYCFEPPFRTTSLKKFLPLEEAVRQIKVDRGLIVVPHVDTVWVGMGRHRLARVASSLGIDGLEHRPVAQLGAEMAPHVLDVEVLGSIRQKVEEERQHSKRLRLVFQEADRGRHPGHGLIAPNVGVIVRREQRELAGKGDA